MWVSLINKIFLVSRATNVPKDHTAIMTVATVVSLFTIMMAVGFVWCFSLDFSCLSVCECCNRCVLLMNKVFAASWPTNVPKDNTTIITVATVVSLLAILLAVGFVWCFCFDFSCLSVCECCNRCVLLINKISLVSRPANLPITLPSSLLPQ